MANLQLGNSEAEAKTAPVKCATCKSVVPASKAAPTPVSRTNTVASPSLAPQRQQQLSTEDAKQADAILALLRTLPAQVISHVINIVSPNVALAPIAMTSTAAAEKVSAISDATSTTATATVPAWSPSSADAKPCSQDIAPNGSLQARVSLDVGSGVAAAAVAATPGAHSNPTPTSTPPSPPVPQVSSAQSEIRRPHWTQRSSAFAQQDLEDVSKPHWTQRSSASSQEASDDGAPASTPRSSSTLPTIASTTSAPAELPASQGLAEVNTNRDHIANANSFNDDSLIKPVSSTSLQPVTSLEAATPAADGRNAKIDETASKVESTAIHNVNGPTPEATHQLSASPSPPGHPAGAATTPSTSPESPTGAVADSSATSTTDVDSGSSTPPTSPESLFQRKSEGVATAVTTPSPGISVASTNDTEQSQAPKQKVPKAQRSLRKPSQMRSAFSSTPRGPSPSPFDGESTQTPADNPVDTPTITPSSGHVPLLTSDAPKSTPVPNISTMKPFNVGFSLPTSSTPAPAPVINTTAPSTTPSLGPETEPALVKEEPSPPPLGDTSPATATPNADVVGPYDGPPRLSGSPPAHQKLDGMYARVFFKKLELSNAQWQALHYELRMVGLQVLSGG